MHLNRNQKDFQHYSDEELISLCHAGNNTGLVLLVTRYLEVIDRKLKGFPNLSGEQDDAKQEALISLVNAVKTYDQTKQTSFSTYAGHCIDNAIKNFAVKLSAKKLRPLKHAVSIEEADLSESFDSSKDNPEQIYIDREQLKKLFQMIELDLSEFEKNVLFCYLDGKSYNQISATLGSSQKAVDNALQRVRKKLKTAFNR
jgi:RNA polymerase sporulation-specific sigma factor